MQALLMDIINEIDNNDKDKNKTKVLLYYNNYQYNISKVNKKSLNIYNNKSSNLYQPKYRGTMIRWRDLNK